ncbi:MAG: type II secretion system F family protein [Alphaproteobacteria bacterium]|nr:type II secretion system F family protein [Alphaproteobacteria bacterium]
MLNISNATLASILISVTLFCIIYFALKRSADKNIVQDRLEMLQGKLKKIQVKEELMETSFIDSFAGIKRTLGGNFKSFQQKVALEYRRQFERAGFVTSNPAILFVVLKTGFIALFLLGYNMLLFLEPNFDAQPDLTKLIVFLVFILVGNRALNIFLAIRIRARYSIITKDLKSAVDLLILATNAGLSLDRAFEMVAEEVSYTNIELGREFAITAIELSVMPDRRQAIKNLAERVEIELIQDLTTTLVQSEEQGTPIAQTLRILSEEFMKKRVLQVETKAARLPAFLVVPLILFILPSLFIVLMTPAIIQATENM